MRGNLVIRGVGTRPYSRAGRWSGGDRRESGDITPEKKVSKLKRPYGRSFAHTKGNNLNS